MDAGRSQRLLRQREARYRVDRAWVRSVAAAAVAAVIGIAQRRVRRCTSTVRCMAGRSAATPVRSWICINPSCGLRRTVVAVTVAIAVRRAMADRAGGPAMVGPTARRATAGLTPRAGGGGGGGP